MRKNKRLEKAGITADRHMELRYFCKQYPHKKEKIKELTYLSGVRYSDMPKGTDNGNPTEERAMRLISLKNDIEIIEQSAIKASGDLYRFVLKYVTKGIEYAYLDAPCGRNYFYRLVENFYIVLDKKKI
ncbi:hypothetical protein [Anaerotignum propionicum]|uniref:DUF1064 domain-containing protein n=1 Tax=Anaerotignum propionicum DSM 1682 TaxID=991789 RepID=A0A0X1U6V8_ANAPI|nr:hypothetical protein [Anaerotignum propionicum]AMJ40686.1 hypothetical protein CPRO_10910 [Anaerotignum propionicum DSM 1682]SHE90146.1 hypothetical protein SAMN02745151_02138 [[Clostridium] propionicum DSM 1682] [Anaerotignum propionicum DSM 1682]